jgi:DNA-binding NarL/FixJ family response regulator
MNTEVAAATVLLADDHALVRDGLKTLVTSLLGEAVFVEAADGDALLEAMHAHPAATLVLVDVGMPAMRGGYRLLEFSRLHPRMPLVVVSARTSPNLSRRFMNIHSVFAIVPESAAAESVRTAITSAIAGRKVPLPPSGCTDLLQPATLLTPRQRQIWALVSQGMSNKTIAVALGIGEGTVKNHITDILRLLNAANRTQAAKLHLESSLRASGANR